MGFKICIQTLLLWMALAVSPAAVLDRIAVTVGNDAITESEVMEEIRITSLLNNEPLDFSAPARRAAAERLVDQYLIRQELAGGNYTSPDAPQTGKLLDDLIKTHYRSRAEFEQKMKEYGVSEDDLKAHLAFQLQAIAFTDLRFNAGTSNEADRAAPAALSRERRFGPATSWRRAWRLRARRLRLSPGRPRPCRLEPQAPLQPQAAEPQGREPPPQRPRAPPRP